MFQCVPECRINIRFLTISIQFLIFLKGVKVFLLTNSLLLYIIPSHFYSCFSFFVHVPFFFFFFLHNTIQVHFRPCMSSARRRIGPPTYALGQCTTLMRWGIAALVDANDRPRREGGETYLRRGGV
jgi:hypothetical protein